MTNTRLMLLSTALAGLAVALVGGIWLAATNVALGTFFFALAIMLGPFAGVALLVCAAAASTALSRSLFSVGGLFLVGAISTLGALPWGRVSVSLPLFIVGTLTGAVAVWLHWAHGHSALRSVRRAHALSHARRTR
ncbi:MULTISPECIES: hypothetical protein [Corynebacterium]|uniref:Uncharacterized protein n=1 Tax=Corynebacterium singulare TaxID=161899 RepID=A0A0B6EZP1_9CORY|nr:MULTISPECIES: hypothetical protein [Corynebacterium]AJI77635.1 hypothetical protein CSING_00330 [Corynebacterium singulare]MCQ9677688.1 hypothetical protein [Corynebacterium sp. BF-R-2]OFT60962.1 hypothetical protein HMPREF3149_06855 [Corynebacterium sp. HMSC05E07]